MRRPTFLRVYSSDATEKNDESTPINRSEDNTRNSIDNNGTLRRSATRRRIQRCAACEDRIAPSELRGTFGEGVPAEAEGAPAEASQRFPPRRAARTSPSRSLGRLEQSQDDSMRE